MTKTLTLVAAMMAAIANSAPLPLHVSGNKVLDSHNRPVVLQGVNCASLEWSSDGEGHIEESVRQAIESWNCNIVRIPLAQDRWYGNGPEQTDGGASYRKLVRKLVDYVASKDRYIMLDMHWSDLGVWGQAIGQHTMPDKNTQRFWSNCAREFRNDPAVLFDLYNEPHDVSWDVWKNGGTVTEKSFDWQTRKQSEATFEAVGMQPLLDTVRSVGARNVCVIGGIDWAYDLSGFVKGYQLADPKGNGLIYACHWYPIKGDTVDKWVAKMETATAVVPVIVSEFGGEKAWVEGTLAAIAKNKWHYTAWDLHPSAGPVLISDWKYTPTPGFGTLVKTALAKP